MHSLDLLMMVEECDRWNRSAREFQSSLYTVPAKVVWLALVKPEAARVKEAADLLQAELDRRA